MSEKEVVRVSLYLPAELKDRVQAIAKSEKKTMNALIVEWCDEKASKGTLEDYVRQIAQRVEALEKEVFKK